jgi:peptide/nickel transport system ATP-binding protein
MMNTATASAEQNSDLLVVRDLQVEFVSRRDTALVVDNISYTVRRGETVGLVGESGCGKSVSSMALLGLLPHSSAAVNGHAWFAGMDLLTIDGEKLEDVRGNEISFIFQEPMTSLNPSMTVGSQIAEVLQRHQGLSRKESWNQAIKLLSLVQIPDPAQRAADYPHHLSGGQRQRVMIAIAIACRPKLLIADEPTTALDVTIQAQILTLLSGLQRQLGMGMLLITHDLSVIAETADRVMVMYAGRIVEGSVASDLFACARHPYTRGLIAARPQLSDDGGRKRLVEIPGTVPSRTAASVGCAFAPRCSFAAARCLEEAPPLVEKAPGHTVACWETDRVVEANAGALPR